MRISDWSSDVCSSDLGISMAAAGLVFATRSVWMAARQVEMTVLQDFRIAGRPEQREDRGVGGERDKPSRETHLSGPSERSEEHTSELQSLMRISYAVFCLKKKKTTPTQRQRKQS